MWRLWIGLLLLSAQTPAFAAVWSLGGSLGAAHNLDTRLRIEKEWFVVGDSAVNVAYAKAHADGDPRLTVTLPQAAMHALLGVGRDF